MFTVENQQGLSGQPRELCSILCDNLMVTRGKDGGRDSQGVWDGHGHTAVFNVENQQGPAAQPRELCSVLCDNLMVTRGKDGGRMGEGIVRESGIDMDTWLYLMWRTNGDLLSSTGNSAQCHLAAWMGRGSGRERMHVYVWVSPSAVHLKPS